MKKFLCIITLLMAALVSGAATVTDTFDRADTTYSTNGADIGSAWVVSSPEKDWQLWRIQANALESDIGGAGGESMLLYGDMQVAAGGGSSFSMSADVKAGAGYTNAWGGICFHYQNPSNYYALRIQFEDPDYQILKVVDGAISSPISKPDAPHDFSLTNFYTLSVSSDAAGVFSFSIVEEGSGIVMNPTDVLIDSDAFSGGYAGLYNTSKNLNPDFIYDNFSLDVSTLSGQIVADDFNRADTPFSTNDVDIAANIGLDWVNAADQGAWQITNNVLALHCLVSPSILFNTGLETISGNGTNFMLKCDVSGALDGSWAGVVFHYQNPSNYYTLRLKPGSTSYQFLSVVDGANDTVVSKSDAAVTFVKGTFYTFTVTSDFEHTFGIAITELGSTNILNPTQDITDNNQRHAGGYAGFYTPTASSTVPIMTYDNFLLNVDALPGTLVTDDFNRADVAYTTDGSQIRSDWVATGGNWGILNQVLSYTNAVSVNQVLYNTAGETISNTNGYSFTVQADVSPKRAAAWGGIIFNYQDPDNYYEARIKGADDSYQIIRYADGATSTILSKSDADVTFNVGSFYTLKVTSTNTYDFEFTITRKGETTIVNPFTTGTDTLETFSGGRAGLFVSSSGNPSFQYDNFILQQISPPPAVIGDVGITMIGTEVVLDWEAQSGETYAAQKSGDLTAAAGGWASFDSGIAGIDGTLYATNDTTEAQAFYRIVIE
jgi:hypothetical protein